MENLTIENITDFINKKGNATNNYCILCNNKKQAKKLLKAAYMDGYRWSKKGTKRTKTFWNEYENDTCYYFYKQHKEIKYSNVDYAIYNQYKVIDFAKIAETEYPVKKLIKAVIQLGKTMRKINNSFHLDSFELNDLYVTISGSSGLTCKIFNKNDKKDFLLKFYCYENSTSGDLYVYDKNHLDNSILTIGVKNPDDESGMDLSLEKNYISKKDFYNLIKILKALKKRALEKEKELINERSKNFGNILDDIIENL